MTQCKERIDSLEAEDTTRQRGADPWGTQFLLVGTLERIAASTTLKWILEFGMEFSHTHIVLERYGCPKEVKDNNVCANSCLLT